jgi:hypothetical protein
MYNRTMDNRIEIRARRAAAVSHYKFVTLINEYRIVTVRAPRRTPMPVSFDYSPTQSLTR